MLITCFACGGNGSGKREPNPADKSNEDKWKDLPDVDFEGRDFRVSTRAEYGNMEVVVGDETSENIVDQALIYRNAKVEDRYNVFIELQNNEANAHINTVLSACTMQMDTFDLAMTYVFQSSPLITNGFVLNWAKLPYTKLEESHWINGMNREFSVRDAIYTSISKMCISILGQTVAMVYNRDLGDEWKGEEFSETLIDTIVDGGWTYDKLMTIVNEYGWSDATNDGRTADDSYAYYMTTDWSIDTWHAAWDIPCIKNTVEKGLEDVMMNDKYLSYASRMQTMYYETPAIFYGKQSEAYNSFMAGKSLFITCELSGTLNILPNMESTYTIIPQPKYDDNQADYRSAMFDNYSVMSVPVTADQEFVSLIVEALSIASEEHVYPAYRFDSLQGTGVSDADSIDMLDTILNNTTWDIATLLSTQISMIFAVRLDIINNPGNSQISQSYDTMKDDIQDSLEEIMEAFDMFQDN
jgi:hypothetical protein